MMLSVVPMHSFAVETDTETSDIKIITWNSSTESDFDSEELYAAYAESLFYDGASLLGTAAGSKLTGVEKTLYDILVPIIRQIANGERASTSISIGQEVTYDGMTYPVEHEVQFDDSVLNGKMLNRLIDALLADLPFECYWYEKTTGCKFSAIIGDTIFQVTLQFTVADNYQGSDIYTADTAKTGIAKMAVDNAKNIIVANSSLTDYEKLVAYRDTICNLVSYDNDAADSHIFDTDIDPWQLISVFDENPNTNVVCEGYSKAFMYLCDQSNFNDDVSAYTVVGSMNGQGHMWNVVQIEGKNYLADVSNSDYGTLGQDGCFFLCGGQGNPSTGYDISGISYLYDMATQQIWGTGVDSLLSLEAENYNPNVGSDSEEHVHSYDTNHRCECGAIGGSCGDNLIWEFQESSGILTISGTGAMYDYSYRTAPWHGYAASIENILMKGGTTIGSYAFLECSAVTNVSIPSSVTAIGQLAFRDCDALREIKIPNSVQQFDRGVFYNCDNLSSVVMPEGITNIPESTFYYCKSLTQINIPDTVTSIGVSAFYFCEYLPQVTIPNGVTSIGGGAFYQCNALTEIVLPFGITRIENRTFAGCDKLTSFTIPTGVTYIGEYAFSQCTGLQSITLPSAVTTLETAAFADCTQMTTVRFMGNAPSIGADAFHRIALTAYHPNNATWTSDVKQNYGGTITWISECNGSHAEVIVPAVPATCIATGLTEGKYCSICGKIFLEQEIILALGHTWADADCTKPKTCSVCKEIEGKPLGHTYDDNVDGTCNACGINRETVEIRQVTHMFRMYNPNTGEHFYTGSEEEKSNLVAVGWNYEGVGFTFPANTGAPVHRLFQPSTGEHLYTMNEAEKASLMANAWNYEGIAFNSAYDTEAVQHRLHNPNATVGAYHFTFSEEEKQNLINVGWEYQGIGWYSCWK